ncbi:hypothetical protein DFO70_10821 [Cytobacillus firmus]|uniref:Uncharacterized protein n=2 Tax=Cytobacillus TaxID=2675230 RepID=A0A366JSX4_CYTFI|nr:MULTISPECIES: hypothetical protein [Cytobacillus]RBP91243.1 hypothetical protein DFO70_10821 [Cytobacillus firmus]TDX41443.1 hypothetical protein DFO72_10821 [Cytobacillus oceanisediminis]
MKKGICCFLFAVLLSVQYLMPAKAADAEKEFEDILEEQLRSTVHYYSEDSFSVIDAYGIQGQVTKIVTSDDPQTSENEEEIEEYSSHIGIVFLELEQKRDGLFIFKKKDFLYYDYDNNEFLTASNVLGNESIRDFFELYADDIEKNITPFSKFLILFFLSFIITVPLFIMIFHNRGQSKF